jgi:hypothetical protein
VSINFISISPFSTWSLRKWCPHFDVFGSHVEN